MDIRLIDPFLPDRRKLDRYLDRIYSSSILSNSGPLYEELTERLTEYFSVNNLLLVANGTLALQVAYKALGLKQPGIEAVTTPFTFVATAGSLAWEGLKPIFADICSQSLCLDPRKVEPQITDRTRLILPVHVYGQACDLKALDELSRKYDLRLIYDASHAFNVRVGTKGIMAFGDASTISFHATKLFQTGEGGAVAFRREEDFLRAKEIINFGLTRDGKHNQLGINAKLSELNAAMGLAVLDSINEIEERRQDAIDHYVSKLKDVVSLLPASTTSSRPCSYMPVIFESELKLERAVKVLSSKDIATKRYFYPSLNQVDYIGDSRSCPISEDFASRTLCLPLHHKLSKSNIDRISRAIKTAV